VHSPYILALAKRQLADYDRHRPGSIFESGGVSLSIAQAYELQLAVAKLREKRGEAIVGYKIGCVSQAIRRQLGLDRPVFGHVFATEIYLTGAVLDSALFEGLSIEGELAARVGEHISDIASIFPVIELHNYIVRSPQLTAQELIANNAFHAGVVLPEQEHPIHDLTKALGVPISVFRNQELLGNGPAVSSLEEILDNLRELTAHLAAFDARLKMRHLILTGSRLPLYRVAAGDRIEVRWGRLGEVSTSTEGPSRTHRY